MNIKPISTFTTQSDPGELGIPRCYARKLPSIGGMPVQKTAPSKIERQQECIARSGINIKQIHPGRRNVMDLSAVADFSSDPFLKLTDPQQSRLLQVTQSLCDNSTLIGNTVAELRAYLLCSVNQASFDSCLAEIREAVHTRLVADMHDASKFSRPKTYHTEYHAQEIHDDLLSVYQGNNLQSFIATLGLAHDLIQDFPPTFGSHLSENETRTAKIFCDMLQANQSKLNMSDSCLSGLKVMAEAIIVHGTYLVNFSESEGVLMMRLLAACRQKMNDVDGRAFGTVLQKLKPVILGVAAIGMTDLYRVTLPGVPEKHARLLQNAGYADVCGFSVKAPVVAKMLYWASHSVRFGGELASYLIDPKSFPDGAEVTPGDQAPSSDFHTVFLDVRAAFLSGNSDTVTQLLSRNMTKVPTAPGVGAPKRVVSTRSFCDHIYAHLVEDRAFIANKDTSAIGCAVKNLYGTPISIALDVPSDTCHQIVQTHGALVSAIEGLPDREKQAAKEKFVTMVLYGAVFQEGYRNAGGEMPVYLTNAV